MFTHEKLRFYLFLFLAFCVLSSKNIIIYNEETLVALSFFCFLFFVSHYFGTTLKNSLNERSQIIQQELQNFLYIKENSFKELFAEHEKVLGLLPALKTLGVFTSNELLPLNSKGEKALKNVFINQLHMKLKTLVFSKMMLQQKLQYYLSENILAYVLFSGQQVKKDKMKSGSYFSLVSQKTIQNAIQLLLKSKIN
jgi:hypothetical protein